MKERLNNRKKMKEMNECFVVESIVRRNRKQTEYFTLEKITVDCEANME